MFFVSWLRELLFGTIDVSGEGLSLVLRRWASKKTAGSTKNGRDSKPKNLGVKKFGGEVREHYNSRGCVSVSRLCLFFG